MIVKKSFLWYDFSVNEVTLLKQNIIFYFSDQQRYDTVNEDIMPNLMQLADEGTFFENC